MFGLLNPENAEARRQIAVRINEKNRLRVWLGALKRDVKLRAAEGTLRR